MGVRWLSGRVGVVDVTPGELGVPFICAYIVRSGGDVAVVEAGPAATASRVYEALSEEGMLNAVRYVIPTHIHLDHGGGTGTLLRLLPTATAVVHPRAVRHVVSPGKLWAEARQALGWLAEVYGEPEPAEPGRVRASKDGEILKLGDVGLEIIHTPGHASHHQSVLLVEESLLFTGDSAGIFIPACNCTVPTTMPPLRLDMYLDSLSKQISRRPARLGYTHYGVVDGGLPMLEKQRKQVTLWLSAVKEAESRGVRELGEVLDLVARYDKEAAKLKPLAERYRLLKLLVELSIEGLRAEAGRLGV